jgi:sugar lactone lactonase YvrE
LYLDITGKKQHSVDWVTKETTTKVLPQMAGCLALRNNGGLIYAMEDGIYTEQFELLHQREQIVGIRFNDGKPAPNGDFFAGTIKKDGGGKLYRLHNDKLEIVIDDVRISNGLDWSVDETTMYYCDTATHTVVAYDFDNGSISNKRPVITVPEDMGHPDGLCIDLEGMLWIALWGGSQVIRVNPDTGKIIESLKLPVRNVSCPAFAGENLSELVITTASEGTDLVKEPLAGCTFLIKTQTKGREPYRFGRSW